MRGANVSPSRVAPVFAEIHPGRFPGGLAPAREIGVCLKFCRVAEIG